MEKLDHLSVKLGRRNCKVIKHKTEKLFQAKKLWDLSVLLGRNHILFLINQVRRKSYSVIFLFRSFIIIHNFAIFSSKILENSFKYCSWVPSLDEPCSMIAKFSAITFWTLHTSCKLVHTVCKLVHTVWNLGFIKENNKRFIFTKEILCTVTFTTDILQCTILYSNVVNFAHCTWYYVQCTYPGQCTVYTLFYFQARERFIALSNNNDRLCTFGQTKIV